MKFYCRGFLLSFVTIGNTCFSWSCSRASRIMSHTPASIPHVMVTRFKVPFIDSALIKVRLTQLLTYSMVQRPSWEASWFAASHEIPRIFMEPEGSLPHSQASATCPCPWPAQSSPHSTVRIKMCAIGRTGSVNLCTLRSASKPGVRLCRLVFAKELKYAPVTEM